MNNIPIYRRTPIHSVARDHFPSLLGRHKQSFLKHAESFIVARDPFERLLSSYKVRTISNIFCCNKVCAGQAECDCTSNHGDMVQFWTGTENHQTEVQRGVSSWQHTNIQRVCEIFGKNQLLDNSE